ncbi:hypothetical protein [Ramlibacter sp. AN1133]|uniref:hypothetical protein n=1 Tax=Ramlibacter sp. AN1133 TaxID=3133429 RepID=UPI0030BEEECD
MAAVLGTAVPDQHRRPERPRRTRSLLVQAQFGVTAASVVAIFFTVVAHHVYRFEFRQLAAFCLPVLTVFFAFTSLLYMRGRSLAPGRDQFRTLFAAERSMRATLHYLTGIVLGTSLYGLLRAVSFNFDPSDPTADGLWLVLFLAPYALMQMGFLLFISAAWVILPQFLRPGSPLQVGRRIGRQVGRR